MLKQAIDLCSEDAEAYVENVYLAVEEMLRVDGVELNDTHKSWLRTGIVKGYEAAIMRLEELNEVLAAESVVSPFEPLAEEIVHEDDGN